MSAVLNAIGAPDKIRACDACPGDHHVEDAAGGQCEHQPSASQRSHGLYSSDARRPAIVSRVGFRQMDTGCPSQRTSGWKARGLWAANGDRTPWLIEGGKGTKPLAAHFQLRPDPLAH